MATLDSVAAAVQLLQSEMEAVKTRIVAAETLAQTRADILDNYVEASTNIHKSIDAQGTKISDAVSTQIRDVAILRKHTDDATAALTKQLADLTGDSTSLQVEVAALKNETATKQHLNATTTATQRVRRFTTNGSTLLTAQAATTTTDPKSNLTK